MGSRAASLVAKPSKPARVKGRKDVPAIHTQRERLQDAVTLAEKKGLLRGRRMLMVRGRMPEKLVAEAKRKTGITSDSRLLEAALANIAVADDYAEWLCSQRGTVDPSLDLEF
ncbi:MAG: hypothetical protein JO182_10435 [Acidobacteriaceae bacterium]|nr:hypothetical protein [Acidobacteriaceae bacterium]